MLALLTMDVAITGGYVVPVDGAPVDGGTVLIRDGKITAVEVDRVVKAGVSEKVDNHLTASAVVANDHQWLIGRQVNDVHWDFRHRNVQGAF